MRVYCCQVNSVWEDADATQTRVRGLLERAEIAAGSLIVLPEMFATGFSMNVAGIADRNGKTKEFIAGLARQYRSHALGGLVEIDEGGRGRNVAVLASPEGKVALRYQKLHPFTPGGESACYAAGEEIQTANIADFSVCPFICYDLRFPEIFRQAVRRGANVFAVIASWPSAREQHWVTLLGARAIENQAYVIGVNRCGNDPNFAYPGRSMIVEPSGNVLVDAGGAEGVISADIDLEALNLYRSKLPFLVDMRRDFVPLPKADECR